jgi:hypothetical protein
MKALVSFVLALSICSLAQTKEEKQQAKEAEKQQKAESKRLVAEQKQQAKIEQNTPPHETIHGNLATVKASIIRDMTSAGYGIESDTEHQIVFTKQVTGFRGAMTQALMGNSYSDPPFEKDYFTFSESSGVVSVGATGEISVRMPLGNVNRTSLTTNKNWKPGVQSLLTSVKWSTERSESTSSQLAAAVAVHQQPPTLSVAATPTKVAITSVPDTADVEIDGKFSGNTPSSFELSPTEHVIVVKRKGFKVWTKAVTLTGGSIKLVAELDPEDK